MTSLAILVSASNINHAPSFAGTEVEVHAERREDREDVAVLVGFGTVRVEGVGVLGEHELDDGVRSCFGGESIGEVER